ncbi:MAG: hypothetical protein HFG80_02395 [Eubacterium sp.]|nr:hypothetical protein [Eubacterium sp.]
MLKHRKITQLNDFFTDLNSRTEKGVFFYRINAYTDEIGEFIKKYYEAARTTGVVIEKKIPNPDGNNLSYYEEIMGMDFQMSPGFLISSLKKWLPRMTEYQRNSVANAMYDTLDDLRKAGKNENMLKNAYIKFMCWLYYRFEQVVSRLGENKVPKILYEGEIGNYELLLITVLSRAGCDVVLLQYHGDQAYLALDPESSLSYDLHLPGEKPFPPEFSLAWIRNQIKEEYKRERLYGTRPEVSNCTNAWITGKVLEDVRQEITVRGTDARFFYNCFCRVNGVEDKLTYVNELYQLYLELRNGKRRVVIVENQIQPPDNEEIAGVRRGNYANQEQMLSGLAANIRFTANSELQKLATKAFLDVMLQLSGQPDMNLNKLTSKAVYAICWLKRYQEALFSNWKMPEVACFIHMGGCNNQNEALFLKILARLPIDVLILNPDLNMKCCVEDSLLYEENHTDSLNITKFPKENSEVRMGTAAYHAERELDTVMYQDSGLYRDQQYQKANALNLQTMYEEIRLLWNEEVKYRPNFSITDDVVNIPVICAKVSGVKDGDAHQYWQSVKELVTGDTFVIKKAPFIEQMAPNPMRSAAVAFYKNHRLLKQKIKEHPDYPYGFLREEVQEHILNKLEILIGQKLIRGTFENGTEYTVIATVLNLPKEIVRMIQKFDFTKKNPKLIFINSGEKLFSLEDAILTAFLNLVGFDIVFFVPTGYQCIEKYFNQKLMEEHQAGEYLYDMAVPDLTSISSSARPKFWRDKIFKRGT